jgi:hypothetical protein
MRTRITIALAIAAIVVAAIVAPQLASADASGESGVTPRKDASARAKGPAAPTFSSREILRLRERYSDDIREILLGEPLAPGNLTVYRDPVYYAGSGALAGHVVVQCTLNFANRFRCDMSLGLNGRGTIEISGSIGFFTATDNLSLNGGTGQFRDAGGEVHFFNYTGTGVSLEVRVLR